MKIKPCLKMIVIDKLSGQQIHNFTGQPKELINIIKLIKKKYH